MLQRVTSLVCLALVTAAIGCGEAGPGKKSTFSATGTLFVDDKPLAGPATLTLANNDKSPEAPSITGNVGPDGKIKFVTYGQDGVVAAGSYAVTLAGDIMLNKPVPATNPGAVEIKAGDKTVDIKLTGIPGAAPVGGLALPTSPP
jgi:hypothetical protein